MERHLAFEAKRKSKGIAYLLWLVFGMFGAHRFYLGRKGSAIAQLILTLTVFGTLVSFPWWLVDAFLIPGIADHENLKTIHELGGRRGEPEPARRIEHARSLDPRVEEIREMGRSRFRKLRDRV